MERIKKAFQDQNFWFAVVLMFGGFWVGFSEKDGQQLVQYVFLLVGTVGTVANFLKNAAFDPITWVKNANFWNYLAIIVTALIPAIDAGLLDAIEKIAVDILNKNWQGVIGGVFTLITFLYKVLNTPKEKEPAPAT